MKININYILAATPMRFNFNTKKIEMKCLPIEK